ncbi:heparaN-alpha-glucosaminide N-acetyltransferase, partial [Trifolium medium]|nr:heparaN-alpha-glucosaminide N-acetyltransferase [Trifolium medium]
VDIWGLKILFIPFKWIGMNAMLVYVMAAEGIFAGFINGWYYDDPRNTLVHPSYLIFAQSIGSNSMFSLEYGIQQE